MALGSKEYGVAASPFLEATDLDVAWAAGLFEGEGCIGFSNRFSAPSLRLSMVDRDVVERFAAIIGIGIVRRNDYYYTKHGWQVQYLWEAGGLEAVEAVICLVPFLGERRTKRAQELIDWYVETYLKECAVCGDPFIARRSDQLYCTLRCTGKAQYAKRKTKLHAAAKARPPIIEKACARCLKTFQTASVNSHMYCESCRVLQRRDSYRRYSQKKERG